MRTYLRILYLIGVMTILGVVAVKSFVCVFNLCYDRWGDPVYSQEEIVAEARHLIEEKIETVQLEVDSLFADDTGWNFDNWSVIALQPGSELFQLAKNLRARRASYWQYQMPDAMLNLSNGEKSLDIHFGGRRQITRLTFYQKTQDVTCYTNVFWITDKAGIIFGTWNIGDDPELINLKPEL